jgi:hypothetical protein
LTAHDSTCGSTNAWLAAGHDGEPALGQIYASLKTIRIPEAPAMSSS